MAINNISVKSIVSIGLRLALFQAETMLKAIGWQTTTHVAVDGK
jgi:hypothetical protein